MNVAGSFVLSLIFCRGGVQGQSMFGLAASVLLFVFSSFVVGLGEFGSDFNIHMSYVVLVFV